MPYATRGPELLYQGLLASVASWARVARGYLAGLVAAGHPAVALATRGFRHDPDFPLPAGITLRTRAELAAGPLPVVGWGFVHPPHLERLQGRQRIPLFVWESDRIPPEWSAPLCACQRIVVPSQFVADALVAADVPRERIAIVPYGHAIHPVTRPPPGERPFTFLFVGAPHWRKGVSELLTAWRQAFTAKDPVQLMVKSSYDPGTQRRRQPFEIDSWAQLLNDCSVTGGQAAPVTVDLSTRTDAEMADLYRSADVLVAPSWGEGFGLAPLEAGASGLPVITTSWGGATEWLPESADRVPFRRVAAGIHGGYVPVTGAHVAKPEVEALVARLRWHASHQDASRQDGARLQQALADRTWTAAAGELLQVLTANLVDAERG